MRLDPHEEAQLVDYVKIRRAEQEASVYGFRRFPGTEAERL